MKVIETSIPDVKILEPRIFIDERGYFTESFNRTQFDDLVAKIDFIQDNQAESKRGTLRGLHFQKPPFAQSKLVRVVKGAVLDVAVDIREGSPTFGKYVAVELSDSNHLQLFVPRGFAHGYLALSEGAIFQYKVDNYFDKASEGGIRFDDTDIGIAWPLHKAELLLSEKDRKLPALKRLSPTGFSFEPRG